VVCVTAIDSDLQVTTEVGELRVLLSFVPLFLWQDQDPSGDKRTRPAISHTTGLRPGCVCSRHHSCKSCVTVDV
jgi:hypothetical protein